ncbi:unnamed protein product, partial [Candidula unifasciata]
MKQFSILCVLLLVMVVLLSVFLGSTEAKKNKGNRKVKAGVCKYDRKGSESPCNTTTNAMTITLNLRKGDPASCAPSKTVSKSCNDKSQTKKKKVKGCKYERRGSDWTECDATTNERTKVMKLKAGSNPECPETRSKIKSCGNKQKGSRRPKK